MAKALLLALIVVIIIAAKITFGAPPYDPFSQRSFPCQEDEALVFIDTPSKDRTGCVSLEELR